jgi:hypothetical protein
MSASRKNSVALDLGNLIRTVRSGESMIPVDEVEESPESAVGQRSVDTPVVEEAKPMEPPVVAVAEPSKELHTITRQAVTGMSKRSRRRVVPRAVAAPHDHELSKRMVGKRSHPDYQLTGLYLRRSTALALKRALLTSEQDMSELVEELLEDWLHHGARDGNETSSTSSRSGQ